MVKTVKAPSQLRRPVKLLVTGAEGAGKTKLTMVWDTSARQTSPETTRSPDFEDSDLLVQGPRAHWWSRRPKKFVTLIVPPGQIANESRKGVFDTYAVPGRRPDGVIHVVCWGYNTPWRGEDSADVRAAIGNAQAEADRAHEQARRAYERAREAFEREQLAQAEIRRAQQESRRAKEESRRLREQLRAARINARARRRYSGRTGGRQATPLDDPSGTGIGRPAPVPLRRTRMLQPRQPRVVATRWHGVAPEPPRPIRVPPAAVIANLREINLQKELEDFNLVSQLLVRAWARRSRAGEQFWLVIALAKCDLYDAAAAARYYLPGEADPRTEFGRILADLRADVPTLRVVVCPVSSGPEPYGRKLKLGMQVQPVLGPDESLSRLNEFWAVVEGLCGITR